jgi:MFS family permease
VRQLVPRFGERTMIVVGTLLMGVGFFVQYAGNTLPTLLVALAITAVGNGFNTPSLSSLISRAAAGDHQGGVLGVSQSLGALARVVGPVVGLHMLAISVGAPYVTGGVAMLVACVFAALFVTQPTTAPPEGTEPI